MHSFYPIVGTYILQLAILFYWIYGAFPKIRLASIGPLKTPSEACLGGMFTYVAVVVLLSVGGLYEYFIARRHFDFLPVIMHEYFLLLYCTYISACIALTHIALILYPTPSRIMYSITFAVVAALVVPIIIVSYTVLSGYISTGGLVFSQVSLFLGAALPWIYIHKKIHSRTARELNTFNGLLTLTLLIFILFMDF